MNEKKRYSKEDLEEFRKVIIKKLDKAERDLKEMEASLFTTNRGISQDKIRSNEDSTTVQEQENLNFLVIRQRQFIEYLKFALIRIKNGTYGLCVKTGKLIDKNRAVSRPSYYTFRRSKKL